MMKTLVFFGSPRNRGQTKALLNELVNNIDGEIEIIDAYHTTVAPCKDCRYCWLKRDCSIKDDMQSIYKKIDEADNIVIATPVYFFSPPAPLKAIIDRLQVYWACRRRNDGHLTTPKKGVILLVGGAPFFEKQFQPAEIMLKMVLKDLNAECLGVVTFSNTDRHIISDVDEVKEVKEVKEKVRMLAGQLQDTN